MKKVPLSKIKGKTAICHACRNKFDKIELIERNCGLFKQLRFCKDCIQIADLIDKTFGKK